MTTVNKIFFDIYLYFVYFNYPQFLNNNFININDKKINNFILFNTYIEHTNSRED
jgi:hypothetical protein